MARARVILRLSTARAASKIGVAVKRGTPTASSRAPVMPSKCSQVVVMGAGFFMRVRTKEGHGRAECPKLALK